MYLDWTNPFLLLLIIACLVFVFTTSNNLMRIGAHLGIFLFLSSFLQPVFVLLYLVFASVHVHMSKNNDNFRLPFQYAILFLAVLAMPLSADFVSANPNNNSNVGGGLPSVVERVELVEKVLEVERLTRQPSVNVLGTDYLPGDEGKLMSYLKVGENPITNATCYINVLYPNMTYFIQNELMIDASSIVGFEGLHYYDFVVPNTTGIYPVNSYCYYETEQQWYVPDTYLTNFTFESGSLSSLEGFDFGEELVFSGGLYSNSTPLSQSYLSVYDALLANGTSHNASDDDYVLVDFTGVLSDFDYETGIYFADINESEVAGGELLLALPFDETSGTTANDISIYGNDGTYFGNPVLNRVGISNTGVLFDRVNDYINVPANNNYPVTMATHKAMVCFGYNSTAFMDNDDVLLTWRLGGNNDGFTMTERGGGSLRWQTDTSLDGQKTVETNTDFSSSNSLHTICAFVDNAQLGIYVNGALDVVDSQSQDGILGSNTTNITFGREPDGSQYVRAFIDEFCYVKGTDLNYTEIAQEYNNTRSCQGSFSGGFFHEGLKVIFNTSYDGLSDYQLRIYTNDTSNIYEIQHYINDTSVNATDSEFLTINGLSTNYLLNVTEYMINMQSSPTSSFRISDDVQGSFVSEIYLERTITNLTSIGTCNEKYCSATFNITLPLGYDTGFLNDFRLFLNAREEGDSNFSVSLFDNNNNNYTEVAVIGSQYSLVQIPINSSNVIGQQLPVLIETNDFSESDSLYLEQLEALLVYNGSVTYDLRGNSELVVSQALSEQLVTIEEIQNLTNTLLATNPAIVGDEQLGQLLIIILFVALMFFGYWVWAGFFGLFYAFAYLSGIYTVVVAVIMAIIIYVGKNRGDK